MKRETEGIVEGTKWEREGDTARGGNSKRKKKIERARGTQQKKRERERERDRNRERESERVIVREKEHFWLYWENLNDR